MLSPFNQHFAFIKFVFWIFSDLYTLPFEVPCILLNQLICYSENIYFLVTGDLRHGELVPPIRGLTVIASPHERFCFHFGFLVYIICDNLNYIYNYKLYNIHFELTFPFTDENGVYWRLTFEKKNFWILKFFKHSL